MTSNESVNKCVRLAVDSIERWGTSPAQVESAIEKAILLAVEEERDGLNPDYEFTFTPREQLIIRLFLMGQEIEDVAARIGKTIERVQQIKSMVIRKLEHSEKLRAKRNLTSGKEGRF